MKTTRIISLFAATLSLILASPVTAAPASKRIGSGKAALSGSCFSTGSHVGHKGVKYVGPAGKGYVLSQ
jgi:hypothetical protein